MGESTIKSKYGIGVLDPEPIDPRCKVNSLGDIANAANYFVGMTGIEPQDQPDGNGGFVKYDIVGGTAAGGWVFEKSTVSTTKINEAYTNENLINPNDPDIAEGKSIDTSGNLTENASYNVTGFIPLLELQLYTGCVGAPPIANFIRRVVYFNDANTVVGFTDPSTTFISFTSAEGATKARLMVSSTWSLSALCVKIGNDDTFSLFKSGTNIEVKSSLKQDTPDSIVKKASLDNVELNVTLLKYILDNFDLVATPATSNLIDPLAITKFKSLDTNGLPVDNEGYHISDFIPVTKATAYASSYAGDIGITNQTRKAFYYNKNKVYISQLGAEWQSLTTPDDDNLFYMRVLFNNAGDTRTLENFYVCQGAYSAFEYFKLGQIQLSNRVSQASGRGLVMFDDIVKEKELSQNLLIKSVSSLNLINPADIVEGYAINASTGELYENSTYHTIFITGLKELQQYTASVLSVLEPQSLRRVVFFNEADEVIGNIDSTVRFDQFSTIANTVKIGLMLYHAAGTYALTSFCLKEGADDIYEEYKETLKVIELLDDPDIKQSSPNSIARMKDIPSPASLTGGKKVTLANSDKILQSGSSSIESFYTPIGKSWLMRAQDFTDWVLVPYGWSGNSAQSIAYHLLNDEPSPSASNVRPSKIKPTYVMVSQTLNMDTELAELDSDSYIQALDGLAYAAKSIGANVMFGTAYTERVKPQLEIAIAELARKHHGEFIPLAAYGDMIIRSQSYGGTTYRAYKGYYGSAHPGLRANELYTARFLGYIERFKRPERSILIFNARNSDDSISELYVRNNMDRAKKFRTIQIGERNLYGTGADRYDMLEPVDYEFGETQDSEYLDLLNGNSIPVKDKFLVEIVIDNIRVDSCYVTLDVTGSTVVYVLNTKTQAYELASMAGNLITINTKTDIDFDKIRVLVVGSDMSLNDVFCEFTGGENKNSPQYSQLKPTEGSLILGNGFAANWTTLWDNTDGIVSYHQETKYGTTDFSDIPNYLPSSNHILLMDYNAGAKKAISRIISNANFKDTFGYQKLRVYVVARLKPLIYDPVAYAAWSGGDNPYTDTSWYDVNSYDYATLCVGFDYDNSATPMAVKRQRVGLFWAIQEFEIDIPMLGANDLKIEVWRDVADKINEAWDMELADIRIEIMD